MKIKDVLNESGLDDFMRTNQVTGAGGFLDKLQRKLSNNPIDIGPRAKTVEPEVVKSKKQPAKTKTSEEPKSIKDLTTGTAFKTLDGNVFTFDKNSQTWKNVSDKNAPELDAKTGYSQYKKAKVKRYIPESKLMEGGAMPGVGPIHISEIEPTLDALEKVLGIDLKNNVLGSVGKKEFSGDIDIALQIDPDKIPEFMEKLKKTPEVMDMAKSSVIMTKVKIVGYDQNKQTTKPRTGYVQVDFMPGDPGWLKTYYHSPSDKESKYKGVFRNIMIATIAAVYDRKDSEAKIDDGRSVESERWMWSPTDGLVRIKRVPEPKKSGDGYTKKNINTTIGDPIKDPEGIAKALGLDSAKDLNSFESLLAAVEKNYPADLVQKIKDSFADNKQVQDVGVPDEVKKEDFEINRIKELATK